jgi:hypothetical protein
MATRWLKIAYIAVWIALLALVILTFDHRTADGEAQAVLLSIIAALGAPISVVAMGAASVMLWLFPGLPRLIDALADTPFLSNDPAWFKLQFSFWWLLALAASYWQWFWLLPRFASIFRRWIMRRQPGATSK